MDASMADAMAMAEMGMPMDAPWTRVEVLSTIAMWTVMMVGMMTPSALPVLLVVAKSAGTRGEGRIPASALAFGAGYLIVWCGFSVVAGLAQWLLHDAALLSPAMAAASPRIAAGILVGAGVYQLTPLKRACLLHCQSPISFLMAHWRQGLAGSLRMGLHHGVYCLGCCWAIMLVLFVVGVMNLAWVAAIGVFVLLEKTGFFGLMLSRFAGAGLVIWGGILLLRSA